MTSNPLAAAVADARSSILTAVPARRDPYVGVVTVAQVVVDATYQRPLDQTRVGRMVGEYDPALVGVLEVSARDGERFAVIDGQHRWAMLREVLGEEAAFAARIHTGLTPAEEANLFYCIDRQRRTLTGWDRWWARRGAGDPDVLDIERVVEGHGLKVSAATKDGTVRATRAMELIVATGGLPLLSSSLCLILSAWGRTADALDGDLLHGLALVLHHYAGEDELSPDRLVNAMQDMAPRQVKARAVHLREAHKGVMPRLVAAVLVDRYNAQPGRNLEDFFTRLPSQSRTRAARAAQTREEDRIRAWARGAGLMQPNQHRVTADLRAAYQVAIGGEGSGS